MDKKLRVGILGGTGMVGQRFIALLENHPWFEEQRSRRAPEAPARLMKNVSPEDGRWILRSRNP